MNQILKKWLGSLLWLFSARKHRETPMLGNMTTKAYEKWVSENTLPIVKADAGYVATFINIGWRRGLTENVSCT